ncbi:MAG TPA: hypothetical protein VJ300_07695 [Thermoplasmata archaeon]|nr:hypothetical protein [Thermoplasmata archaeon]
MVLEARIGLLRDTVLDRGIPIAVRRESGGWRSLPLPGGSEVGRVLYDGLRDRISVVTIDGTLDIRFRWRRTSFEWRGRRYAVGRMLWGHFTITEGTRIVASGTPTMSGVRLDDVMADLEPIARALVLALALRVVAFGVAVAAGG